MAGVDGFEREAKLAVVGEGRGAFLEGFTTAARLDQLELGPFRELRLLDEYFDLEGEPLSTRLCALRLRRTETACGDRLQLAFKGAARASTGSALERVELEAEWSPSILAQVLGQLASLGVPLVSPAASAGDDPRARLEGLGFHTLQVRETTRHQSELQRGERPVAELALDRVHYAIGDSQVVHREIEIEALGETSLGELEQLAQELLRGHPERLRPWPWSKTALGRALEELQAAGELGALLVDGELTVAAYGRIAAQL